MKTLSPAELHELMQDTQETCVSIYMPRHRESAGLHKDRLVLKNLLKKSEQHLLEEGWRASEAKTLLAPARELLTDDLIWQQAAKGLALFVSNRTMHVYPLPRPVMPLFVTAHHFYIMPLLALQDMNHSFYVLALSRNRVRLLHATQDAGAQVQVEGLPENLEQALEHEVAEKQSGFRPLPASIGGGGRQAIFYGQGAGPDDDKDELVRYLRVIDAALHAHLQDERAPLVLAAVDYLLPLYRQVNTCPYLVEQGIEGNPDDLSADELVRRGWDILQPQFTQPARDAVARYKQLAGTGLTSCDLEEIVRAAFEGRVAVLLAAPDVRKWGHYDPATETVFVQPVADRDGDELLNLAAIYTLSNGGQVYFVEPKTPGDDQVIAAIYRY